MIDGLPIDARHMSRRCSSDGGARYMFRFSSDGGSIDFWMDPRCMFVGFPSDGSSIDFHRCSVAFPRTGIRETLNRLSIDVRREEA